MKFQFTGGLAPDLLSGRYITYNSTPSANHRPVVDFDVVGHAGLAGKNNSIADLTAAADTNLGSKQTAFAYDNIMSYLNTIVYFSAGPDHGITELGPVNTAVGTYLDTIFN